MERIVKSLFLYLSAAILALLFCDLTSVRAEVLYVDGGVSSSGNGTSWGEAFKTIVEAVDDANEGDEIWVKAYTYPTVSTILIQKNILLYGGFNGTETQRNQRDWVNNVTTLDGQNSGLRRMYIGSDATIDGFVITGGEGGGMYISSSAPIIKNCVFFENTVKEGTMRDGGGIRSWNAFPTITNCVFIGNEVDSDDHARGGGLYASESDGLNLTNCIFVANKVTGYNFHGGGGAYIEGMATIINCTFVRNSIPPAFFSSEGGGGIYIYYSHSSTTITNCILWDNYQESTGNPDQIKFYGFHKPFVSYSNIDQDGFEGGNGNIRLDPLFINPDDDYHLQSSSPCIDVGDPNSDYSNEPDPNGCRINLGAFGNTTEATTSSDPDFDGIYGVCDNCPDNNNPNQEDYDEDGVGDVCDNCPEVSNEGQDDTDGDGLGDMCDECTDTDGDGYGNPGFPSNTCPLDNCPDIYNISQENFDEDDFGNVCDQCPYDFDNDIDGDGICGDVDNCPAIANPDQEDRDGDGFGDRCDDDDDNDGILDADDNCKTVSNPDQTDSDSDGIGDVCDSSPYLPALRPAVDGHSYHKYLCRIGEYPPCYETAAPYVDNGIIVSYKVCCIWPVFYDKYINVGNMEFDVSSIDGLFTSGQIEALLTLTVKEGDVPDDRCLTLYNPVDGHENGVIEENEITGSNISEVCADLRPGDSITFDVTSAIEHDLFDPDQTDFSGFILRSSDWENWEDWIEFYDHTDLSHGPRLSISDGDGIFIDDNCPFKYNPGQEDTCPPEGNGIGDACDCEGDFDCDGDCDGTDASAFKVNFGRNTFGNPCEDGDPCNGDFDCDGDCDGTDATGFKSDFGRSSFNNSCPACVVGDWCNYPLP